MKKQIEFKILKKDARFSMWAGRTSYTLTGTICEVKDKNYMFLHYLDKDGKMVSIKKMEDFYMHHYGEIRPIVKKLYDIDLSELDVKTSTKEETPQA